MMWGWCGRAPRARQPVARAAKSRIRAEATGHIPTIRSGPPAPIDGALQHDRGAGIDSIPGHPVGDQEHAAADRRLSCACVFSSCPARGPGLTQARHLGAGVHDSAKPLGTRRRRPAFDTQRVDFWHSIPRGPGLLTTLRPGSGRRPGPYRTEKAGRSPRRPCPSLREGPEPKPRQKRGLGGGQPRR